MKCKHCGTGLHASMFDVGLCSGCKDIGDHRDAFASRQQFNTLYERVEKLEHTSRQHHDYCEGCEYYEAPVGSGAFCSFRATPMKQGTIPFLWPVKDNAHGQCVHDTKR